jgi:hypothetical protein
MRIGGMAERDQAYTLDGKNFLVSGYLLHLHLHF